MRDTVGLRHKKVGGEARHVANQQERWKNNETKGQWTKRLISELKKWVACKRRRVDYFLTQAVTGHDSYRTKRIGKDTDDMCMCCDDSTHTVEHTVFMFKR